MTQDELLAEFAALDDWQERYSFVIELGKALMPMPDADKNEHTRVVGCMSQVWLKPVKFTANDMQFTADSDAHIVKGLIAILLIIYNGRSATDVIKTDIAAIFETLGMHEHLSPNRRNGFFAMVEKIQNYARAVT